MERSVAQITKYFARRFVKTDRYKFRIASITCTYKYPLKEFNSICWQNNFHRHEQQYRVINRAQGKFIEYSIIEKQNLRDYFETLNSSRKRRVIIPITYRSRVHSRIRIVERLYCAKNICTGDTFIRWKKDYFRPTFNFSPFRFVHHYRTFLIFDGQRREPVWKLSRLRQEKMKFCIRIFFRVSRDGETRRKKKGKNSTNFVYYILSLSRLDFQYSLSPIRINFIDIQLIYTWPYQLSNPDLGEDNTGCAFDNNYSS